MTSDSFTPRRVAIFLTLSGCKSQEQLLLCRGGAHLHQAPRAQNVFLDRGANPPHGIGRQPEAFVRLEALDRLHQADIAFGDDLADRQAVTAVAHGDAGYEAQMGGDKLVRGIAVAMLAPTLGEHVLLLRLQHGEQSDFFEITCQPAMGTHAGQTSGGH
jgi:hypothetical protein